MVHQESSHGIEGHQSYTWAEVQNMSAIKRITVPLFSSHYKTNTTSYCIQKAIQDRAPHEDDEDADIEEEDPKSLNWRAPEPTKTFNMDTFFSLYYIHLQRAAPLLFKKLRQKCFGIDDVEYHEQFRRRLRPVSGLGFSGSLFFFTDDRSLIVKSINRRFEYLFLYEDLINAYGKYMQENKDSTLCRITDVLYSFDHRLGSLLGVSPNHYVVMKNSLDGLDEKKGGKKWDLKPQSFFEPTRDLVPDAMKSEAAKSGLADALDEEIFMTRQQKKELMRIVEEDARFLTNIETIDYSLLVGRYPIDMVDMSELPQPESPVSGMRSSDGKWVYKFCIVDFLWNVKQLHPQVIQVAGKALPEQTVTTEPGRYREEFLK
ncbi:SAICAR synthase-like protein [Ascobolus immersus RN42]|uniref:SAICAR synthase-like protein n=1 Tax=Ascobolus immersus RN42 TaxID=1160509 RepID=A0A3N4HT10_ASCIM|nr:SAICAR synthase-like protein [Ascobolus immersus RN42]